MLQTSVVEKIKAHFLFNNFFRKSCRLRCKAEKFCRDGQATV